MMDTDDGGMGALDAALDPITGVDDLVPPMDAAADALTGAMDAAQIQGGDSAPADAAAMDQVAADTVEEVSEVDEASEDPVTPDEPIV
jgi:hypothetical protein